MGYQTMGDEILGEEILGDEDYETVGLINPRALRAVARARGRRMLQAPRRPGWRQTQMAPGVQMPGEGLIPLPLTADSGTTAPNTGTFSSTITTINFSARPQKPFHAERLITTVRRTGASANGVIVLCTTMFVGTDLQTAEVGAFDIEHYGPTAFGVRLSLKPAEPGVLIRLTCQSVPTLTNPDTINVSMEILGRYVG